VGAALSSVLRSDHVGHESQEPALRVSGWVRWRAVGTRLPRFHGSHDSSPRTTRGLGAGTTYQRMFLLVLVRQATSSSSSETNDAAGQQVVPGIGTGTGVPVARSTNRTPPYGFSVAGGANASDHAQPALARGERQSARSSGGYPRAFC